MRVLLILILASLFVLPVEAKIYRWTDSSGQVHFTDQPHKGAVPVDLPPVQTYSPPEPAQKKVVNTPPSNAVNDDETSSPGYKVVRIVQPTQEATIRNNQGLVPVLVEFDPQLKANDKVQLIFDGKPLGSPQNSPTFTLTDVYRGSHTVSVQVFSSDGQMINESEPVTFFMHRARVGQAAGAAATGPR